MKFAAALFLPFAALAMATPAQAAGGESGTKARVTASASVKIVESGSTREGRNRIEAQRTRKASGETLVEFS